MKKQSYKKTVFLLLKILRVILNTTVVAIALAIISWIVPYFDMLDITLAFIAVSLLFIDFIVSLLLIELLRKEKMLKLDDSLIPSV
jgi:hypothetical protein